MDTYGRRQVLLFCATASVTGAGCLNTGNDTDDGEVPESSAATDDGDDSEGQPEGNENRLEAAGTVVGIEATELVIEEMGDAEVVRLDAGFGEPPELEAVGESLSPSAGIYPVVADSDPDDVFGGETKLGTIQVGEVTHSVKSWDEGDADLENATIEDGVLVQQDPEQTMIAEFELEIDDVVGQMEVYPDDRMESEAEVILNQPGASYGFFVESNGADGQGKPAGIVADAFEAGTYELLVDSEPNVQPASEGIVAIDRVEFYAGSDITILERGG